MVLAGRESDWSDSQDLSWAMHVLNASADGIFVMDSHGIVIYVNPSWERLVGLKASDVLGRYGPDLVREGYFQHGIYTEVIKTGRPVTVMNDTKAGFTVLSTGTPVWGAEGELVAVVINVRDITELTKIKEELERTRSLTQQYAADLKALMDEAIETGLVFRSHAMWSVKKLVGQIARTDCTVLITGETGVGKDAIARYIHGLSSRSSGPFITLNCSAIPDSLFESELFGYESGAFTGAKSNGKPGLLELANHGTLFLDEVGEMPAMVQAKLLHAIEERQAFRVGGIRPVPLDARIIAATNRDLEEAVRKGVFREDLYYRLNVVKINIPPLRCRKEEIPVLSLRFLRMFNERYGLEKVIHPKVLETLCKWSWPGNIRELRNLIESLVLTTEDRVIRVRDLPRHIREGAEPPEVGSPVPYEPGVDRWAEVGLKVAMKTFEKEILLRTLRSCGSLRRAAKRLGIDQSTMTRKARKYGIRVGDSQPDRFGKRAVESESESRSGRSGAS